MTTNTEFINTIKLLLYKENPSLLEKVDFEDDNVFLDPLLFAYFNSKKENMFSKDMLTEIMQGYFIEKEPLLLKESFNNDTRLVDLYRTKFKEEYEKNKNDNKSTENTEKVKKESVESKTEKESVKEEIYPEKHGKIKNNLKKRRSPFNPDEK